MWIKGLSQVHLLGLLVAFSQCVPRSSHRTLLDEEEIYVLAVGFTRNFQEHFSCLLIVPQFKKKSYVFSRHQDDFIGFQHTLQDSLLHS